MLEYFGEKDNDDYGGANVAKNDSASLAIPFQALCYASIAQAPNSQLQWAGHQIFKDSQVFHI